MENRIKTSDKRIIAGIAAAIAIAVVLLFGSGMVRDRIDHKDNGSAATAQTKQQTVLYYFRRGAYLTEHFEKHGGEFGYETEEEYLLGANQVILSEDSLHKLEAEDGDHVFFQESTGSIVFLSADGYIRTYFKPADGIDYYNRQ